MRSRAPQIASGSVSSFGGCGLPVGGTWYKLVDNQGGYPQLIGRMWVAVYKPGQLCTTLPKLFIGLSHSLSRTFISVSVKVLPTIHTTYKDKSILRNLFIINQTVWSTS